MPMHSDSIPFPHWQLHVTLQDIITSCHFPQSSPANALMQRPSLHSPGLETWLQQMSPAYWARQATI